MDEQISPYLNVVSPSKTAVKYTISSRSKEPKLIVVILKHVLRVIVAFYTILATIAKLQATFNGKVDPTIQDVLHRTLMNSMLQYIMKNVQWWLLCLTSLITLYICVRRDYTEESLLVLQGLGVQTSTTSSYFFLSPTTTFIPTTQIQDIVINEAFKGFEVRFYLAIIVVGATEVVVVFPTLLPRRPDLEVVWRGSRKCLYSDSK